MSVLICAAGDIHGAMESLYNDVLIFEAALGARFDWVLHVGDFGIWPDPKTIDRGTRNHEGAGDFSKWLEAGRPVPRRTVFIKGDHEDFVWLDAQKNTEVLPGLIHRRNGCKIELEGSRRETVGLGRYAQMPFYTDDASTTATGRFHVEVFEELDRLPSSQYPDLRQNTANIKLNFSPVRHVEFDVDAPYIQISGAAGSQGTSGIGDTELGAKWAFREAPPDSNLATFAASFYVEFPNGSAAQGLGSGLTDYWLNFIAEKPLSPTTRYHINIGILFAGNTSTGAVGIQTRRGQVYTGGLSLLHDVSPRLALGGEIYGGICDGAGTDRSQLQMLLRSQYAIRNGLSVSLGVLGGRFGATPRLGGRIGVAMDFPDCMQRQPQAIQ